MNNFIRRTYAIEHRRESLDYAMTFALASHDAPGVTRERIERFVDMYVTNLTLDMGDRGREAVRRLLEEGARFNLCPAGVRADVI